VCARGFTAGQKNVENQDQAIGPLFCQTSTLLGRHGPWAMGLLLGNHKCEMRKELLKLELILRNAILELFLKIRIIS